MNLWIAASCVVALGVTLAQDRAESKLELYDVRDLVVASDPAANDAGTLEFLRTVLERAALAESSHAQITCANGAIVVRGTGADQSTIRDYLDRMRRDAESTYTVNVTLVELGPDGVDAAAGPVVVDSPPPVERELFDSPLLVRPFRRGMVDATRTQEYITGYRVYHDVLPLAGRLVVPQIESFASGAHLDALVAPMRGEAVALKLRVQHVAVDAPVATETTDLGPIATPKLRTSTVDSVLELGPGTMAVLALPGEGTPRTAFLVEVTANR